MCNFLDPGNPPGSQTVFKYGSTSADTTGDPLTELQMISSVDAVFTASQELTGSVATGANISVASFANGTDKVLFIQVPAIEAAFTKWSEVGNSFQQDVPIDATFSSGTGIWFKSARAGETIYICRYQTTFTGAVVLSR